MTSVLLLGPRDAVRPDDWCRPLQLEYGDSDQPSETSYGMPLNNLRWARASQSIGGDMIGKTPAEICQRYGRPYEFLRGDIPAGHAWRKP